MSLEPIKASINNLIPSQSVKKTAWITPLAFSIYLAYKFFSVFLNEEYPYPSSLVDLNLGYYWQNEAVKKIQSIPKLS